MMQTTKLVASMIILSFIFIIPGLFVPFTTIGDSEQDSIRPDTNFAISAQELTTWYHDGSNTTGWIQSGGSWPLISTGTELYSPITSLGSGVTHHSSFYYDLEKVFVVGNDLKWEIQFNYTPNASASGGLNVYLITGSNVAWRVFAWLYGTSMALSAHNFYTMSEYDQEGETGSETYISVWYNSSNGNTETTVGDGTVSTSDHAGVTRSINRVALDFWWRDDGSVYGDTRMDWMRITGGTPPEIDSPQDVNMEYSEIDRSIIWQPEAYFPNTYELLINGSSEGLEIWDGSMLEFPLIGLGPGYYEYQLIVTDEIGMEASDIVLVNVTDTTPPIVSNPDDRTIEHGSVGGYLSWECDEPYPDFFIITRNGSVVSEGIWNGTNLMASLNGLDYGLHRFLVSVNDTHGNSAKDEVNVTVIYVTPPAITPLDDDTIELGTVGEYLNWTCSSDFPNHFVIVHNETVVNSGLWNSSYLLASLDGLDFGTHWFSLTVNDTYGHEASDIVIIEVEDTTSPEVDSPEDIFFEHGTAGQVIVWHPSDLGPAGYIVLRDGSVIQSDTWNGSEIIVELDNLDIGIYNFTIIVTDLGDNHAFDQVIVTVQAASTTSETTTSTTSTVPGGSSTLDPMLMVGTAAVAVIVIFVLAFQRIRSKRAM